MTEQVMLTALHPSQHRFVRNRIARILLVNLPRASNYEDMLKQFAILDGQTSMSTSELVSLFAKYTFHIADQRIAEFESQAVKPDVKKRHREGWAPISESEASIGIADEITMSVGVVPRSGDTSLAVMQGCQKLYDWQKFDSYLQESAYALEYLESEYRECLHYDNKGYAYFLVTQDREPPLVKIGYQSTIGNSRSHSVHSHCPYDLVNLGTCRLRNGVSSEKDLHKQFEDYRFNREWFVYDGELVDRIQSLINRGYYDTKYDMVKDMSFCDWFYEWIRFEQSWRTMRTPPDRFCLRMVMEFLKIIRDPIIKVTNRHDRGSDD